MTTNNPLTKNDLCWVLVKLFGAVLLYFGISSLYSMVVTWWALSDMYENLSKSGAMAAFSPLKILFWGALFPLVIGVRLLVSGSTLHGWLMRVPIGMRGRSAKMRTDEVSLAEVRLTAIELEEFKVWLEKNPEVMKRDEVDQLALFRDAQKAGEV